MLCIVCNKKAAETFKTIENKHYWKCRECLAIFLDKQFYLEPIDEHSHYLSHKNSINDAHYRKFLSQLMLPLDKTMQRNSIGLDYGCGPGPALSKMLEERGHIMHLYDPFFYPNRNFINKVFDFICCTETAEHFHNPYNEFDLFNNLLKNNGVIGIMTNFTTDESLFENWHYRRDPTHVVFYNETTFQFIAFQNNWDCEIVKKDIVLMREKNLNIHRHLK